MYVGVSRIHVVVVINVNRAAGKAHHLGGRSVRLSAVGMGVKFLM
jgi:hypothetical protein